MASYWTVTPPLAESQLSKNWTYTAPAGAMPYALTFWYGLGSVPGAGAATMSSESQSEESQTPTVQLEAAVIISLSLSKKRMATPARVPSVVGATNRRKDSR